MLQTCTRAPRAKLACRALKQELARIPLHPAFIFAPIPFSPVRIRLRLEPRVSILLVSSENRSIENFPQPLSFGAHPACQNEQIPLLPDYFHPPPVMKISLIPHPASIFTLIPLDPRGPFLETSGNSTGPKSYFEIKVSRKLGCVLTSDEVHFVSLTDNFTVQFSKLLKLLSGASRNWPQEYMYIISWFVPRSKIERRVSPEVKTIRTLASLHYTCNLMNLEINKGKSTAVGSEHSPQKEPK